MLDQKISVAIEEYKTLRQESLESMKGQQSTVRMGMATVGVVIAAGFNVWDKTPLSDLVFLAFNPIICYLTLIIWIGEVTRMMRVGNYLSLIEKKLNGYFKEEDPIIYWENWLRTKNAKDQTPQLKDNYKAIISLFLGTAISSTAIGFYRIWDKVQILTLICGFIIELLLFVSTFEYMRRTSNKLQQFAGVLKK